MIKLLIGGSPCTYWSVAQKKGRETEAEGLGWELFKNYLIAKEKFKPDFFLYENNKSAAQPIKDQISRELGVDLMYINSALVSAQNRQRFYAFNWRVDQPADRGIMLKDILESGFPFGDMIGKSFCLTSNYCKGSTAYQTLEHHKRTLAAEAIPLCDRHTGGGYMSNPPPITITSEELRERVEEYLDRWIPDDVWNRSEPYARRKLDLCRKREPEVEYYNNEYLVLLAADTVRETEFSDFTLADYAAKMAAGATS